VNRLLQTALAILALTASLALGAVGFAAYGVVGKLGTSLDKLNLALDTVNRPCAPGPCGLLANGIKVETKVGDAIVTTQLQERATAPHVIAAMDTFRDSAIHLSGTADSLSGTADALTRTADAGTQTAQALTVTVGTAGTTIAALQPLVGHVDSAVTSLDTSLQTTSLDLDAVLQHTEAITSSAAKVSDHFEKMIDAPKKHTFWGDVKAGWQIIWQVAMLAK
jgi:hypothetical protein